MEMIIDTESKKSIITWLNYKNVSRGKYSEYRDHLEILIESCEQGCIRVNKDFTITQKLNSPIANGSITELIHRPNVKYAKIFRIMLSMEEPIIKVRRLISIVTQQPLEVIEQLKQDDMDITQSIACFYIK